MINKVFGLAEEIDEDVARNVACGQAAVEAFAARSGGPLSQEQSQDPEHLQMLLGDLLGDLRHWAAANGVDYDEADMKGQEFFNDESEPLVDPVERGDEMPQDPTTDKATYLVTWSESSNRSAELTAQGLAGLMGITPEAVNAAEPNRLKEISVSNLGDALAELDDAWKYDFSRDHITITRI